MSVFPTSEFGRSGYSSGVNAPLSRQLSREEYSKLSVEQQLEYMEHLMAELRARSIESRRQLEQAKETLATLEKKYPTLT